MALCDDILNRVRGHGRGFVFTAKDFLDLGDRSAIDQALTRLARNSTIRRIDRGVYDLPRLHAKIGPLWPAADVVARAIARQTDSHIKAAGPFAANTLGLTTQVPSHAVFLTDGPSRKVHVGNLVVELRHANRVDMLLPDTTAGLAIVALRYLGRKATSSDALGRISAALNNDDRHKLRKVQMQLPHWLGSAVSQLASA